jgi:FecR protein
MSDYLWDRSGPQDEEILALERALEPLRYRRPLDARRLPAPPSRSIPYMAIAASILLGVLAWRLEPGPPSQITAWSVNEGGPRLVAGQRLSTGNARVTLEAEDFGEVSVEPHSELSVVESRAGRQRMMLERGRIHALIWAPPRQFVVETPSARAIDLGCEYNLSVDSSGNGFVTVETGWVAFQFRGNESFIPAGAACRTYRQTGPGIPFFEDAPARFTDALARFESTADPEALSRVIAEARPKDGLSLWHLLSRVSVQNRRGVFDRFAQLVRLPPEVKPDRVLALDPHSLDLCWNALQLDDADWWREWKREWKP